ncbi:MAG: class I SAM-dependent methyltransferase [Chloroflexi bacterium]|nr:class I SAM-dependent methyltransferase [Chloroflexota bacterium]
MDVKYWNDFADEYDEFVIDAFTYGRSNTIAATIERFASPELDIADYGCGPGKMLPFLARKFHYVYGYDFSDKLLDIARRHCVQLKNVEIAQADLSQPVDRLPMTDVIVSLNAVIMPDPKTRTQFMRGMASRIKPGGHLIMNVPSVESLLYTAFRETEWYRRQGYTPQKAEFQTDISSLTGPRRLAQGVLNRGSEPTKHYLREELMVLVRDEMRLDLVDMIKMEYDWKTDFENDDIPDWMGEPYPWDWLVIAKAK